MAKPQDKNHARLVFGTLAGVTGVVLVAAFVAPFYGALDRPVTVIESGGAQGQASGNGIVVEQFDYTEPDANAGTGGTSSETAPAPAPDAGDTASRDEGALEREAPRPPLSDLGLAAAPKPPEPPPPATPVDAGEQMQLLPLPVAVAAGRLESQGRIVDLQGIEVMPIEEMCQSPSGESWPCGMQGRTAFRQWLRSRAIMCRLPQSNSGGAVATECRLGNEDAALWLVSNGWVKATPGGAYAEAGQKAQEAKLGIYGAKPDTTLPGSSSSPDVQSLSPLAPEMEPQPSAPSPQQGEFPPPPVGPAQ